MPRIDKEDVRNIRERLKLTQQALADLMGVHVRTVRDWEIETGARGAAAAMLLRLDEEAAKGR